MSSPTSSPPIFREDLKRVRRVAWGGATFILFILAIPANGLQASILQKLLNPGLAGPEELLTFWQVISLTAPLTLAVAIIFFGLLNPLVRSAAELSGHPFWISILIAAVVFFVTAVACDVMGFGAEGLGAEKVQKTAELASRQGGHWGMKGGFFIVSILVLYAKAYHPSFFISSIITGGILGWAVDTMLPHIIKHRT